MREHGKRELVVHEIKKQSQQTNAVLTLLGVSSNLTI